jgi:DNA-binding transcriptional LysR family regulator
MISQPTVSQHISALESRIGQKLFVRKSKGVIETDEGKILNTLVSGAIENLEDVEYKITHSDSEFNQIITIGVSEHLYKSTLCRQLTELGSHVHVRFGTKQELKAAVENGKLYCAIVPEKLETFDLICELIYAQKLFLVASPDIDLPEYDRLFIKDKNKAEKWLNKQTWFAHNSTLGHIKLYWIRAFDKKRPSILPNYIIPNEHEVLHQMTKHSGLCVASDSTLIPFLNTGKLITSATGSFDWRELYLISNKKQYNEVLSHKIIDSIKDGVLNV